MSNNYRKVVSHTDKISGFSKGVELLRQAVASTMGARGRNVIIEREHAFPHITKDGVSVAREVNLKDNSQNTAVKILRDAAERTVKEAGDGTTTSTVLAAELYTKGLELLSTGINPIYMKRGMDTAYLDVIKPTLEDISESVETEDQIKNIAVIAANGDEVMGDLVAKAFNVVGKDGIIVTVESEKFEDSIDIKNGMTFDAGFESNLFVNNTDDMTVEYEDPYILVLDRPLLSLKQIVPLLTEVSNEEEKRPLIIIAEQFNPDVIAALAVNNVKGNLKVAAVKLPMFGADKKEAAKDIAAVVGAQCISAEAGLKYEDSKIIHLGSCDKITIDTDTTSIINGKSKKIPYAERLKFVKTELKNAKTAHEREKLKSRIGKIEGKSVIIKVAASSDSEMKEKRDRLHDSISSCRSAIEEGVVSGGGTTLLFIKNNKDKIELSDNANPDFLAGFNLVLDCLDQPFKTILTNAGMLPDEIDVAIKDLKEYELGTVFDVNQMTIIGKADSKIIDPSKVERVAIKNAISAAGILLTADVALLLESKDETA